MKYFYGYIYAVLTLLLWSGMQVHTAAAHPHVFIAQETAIVFDQAGLAGFKIHWTFDEMFSVMIGEDFDQNKDGHLNNKEVAVIKEKAFGYIAPHNYYIQVKIDGKPFAVKFIKDFNAVLNDGKLSYDFFIPCHVKAVKTVKKIVISPYDPEYYSAIYFPDIRHLTLENSSLFEIETRAERDMSTLFFHETVNPLAIFVNFRLK